MVYYLLAVSKKSDGSYRVFIRRNGKIHAIMESLCTRTLSELIYRYTDGEAFKIPWKAIHKHSGLVWCESV